MLHFPDMVWTKRHLWWVGERLEAFCPAEKTFHFLSCCWLLHFLSWLCQAYFLSQFTFFIIWQFNDCFGAHWQVSHLGLPTVGSWSNWCLYIFVSPKDAVKGIMPKLHKGAQQRNVLLPLPRAALPTSCTTCAGGNTRRIGTWDQPASAAGKVVFVALPTPERIRTLDPHSNYHLY